jgi:RHS repeat-associated protein
MKNFYYTLVLLAFSLYITAQTSPTGDSKEVGITEGQLSVSLTGGATYSVPIAVPPGINGVVPQIGLVYNSQRGNGIAGYGWNISGVSSITRIPSTKFHDGTIDAVDFDALDRFALDGQRLVVKRGTSGVYGANATVYETEGFSNVKITSYGVHPSGANYGPAYFQVEYPDGSIAQYGDTSSQYGSTSESRSIMEWSITYWQNSQGVRINYLYSNTNNNLLLTEISYGGVGVPANAILNTIQFSYTTRTSSVESYVGGQSIINNYKLDAITIKGFGVGYRNYKLDHTDDRLYKITEKSGDNSLSYNPTRFYHDRTIDEMKYLPIATNIDVGNVKSINAGTVSGDFDGDGNMDFLLYPTIGTEVKKSYRIFTDLRSGTNNINFGYKHDVGSFETIFPVSWINFNNKLMPMQGWCVVAVNPTTYTTSFNNYSAGITNPIYTQGGKSYDFPKLVYSSIRPGGSCENPKGTDHHADNIPKEYVSGDFNGDGITDVLAIEKNMDYDYYGPCDNDGNLVYYNDTHIGDAYFVDLNSRKTTNFVFATSNLNVAYNEKLEVTDINGDGKSDLLVFKSGSVRVFSLNDANKLELLYTSTDAGIQIDKPILIGDYNGDGKSDFLIPSALGSNVWNKYSSTGTSFAKNVQLQEGVYFSANNSSTTYNFIAADYNKDGKTDLIKATNKTDVATGKSAVFVDCYINTNGWFSGLSGGIVQAATSQESDIDIYALPIFLPSNQNSIYNATFTSSFDIAFINQSRIHFFESKKDFNIDRLLGSVITGNGVKESISYQPLNSKYNGGRDAVYSPSSYIGDYPTVDIEIAPNFRVVSKLEKQSSAGSSQQEFKYYGAVSNEEGLGFLGFRSTVRTNWYNDPSKIISSISKFDIDQRGANTENYTVLGLQDPLTTTGGTQTPRLLTKEGDYTVTGTENLVATQRITLKPNTWIKSGSTFSAKIIPEANKSSNTPTDFITKSILTYESDVLANKVFKIQNTNSKEYNSLENTNSETTIVYDVNNNPTQSTTVIREGSTTIQTAVANVVYEDQTTASPYYIGRTKSKTQSISVTGDTMTNQEEYEYTSDLLLKKVTKKGNNTPDSIVEDNLYDSFGNITKKTITAGSDSRFTSYKYDATGRFMTKSTDAELLTTSYAYNPNNGVLDSITNPYKLKTIYEYDKWFKKTKTIDYLGKFKKYDYSRINSINTLITATGSDDGSFSQEIYDDLGRKKSSTIKDITTALSNINYEYDLYDRPIKVSEPFYGTSTSDFNVTEYDVYGRVKKSIPFKGRTVTIDYNGLVTTVNDGSKTKESKKNAIGELVSVKDIIPSGGTISYTYFANGNLKSSNFDGVVTTITQDGWGRKKSIKDESAGLYSYDYNSFGELTNETTPTGSTAYSLDQNGRLQTKTISGPTSSVTTYQYDALKRLISSEFNDGIKTNYTYGYDPTTKNINSTTEYNATYNTTFTKSVFYDAWGRVGNETSTAKIGSKSSSKTITNTYLNGFAWQILDGNTVLWQTNTVNARGQVTNAILGNGLAINNEYEFGFIKKSKLDKSGSTINLMTLTTIFDPIKGNLDNRTNSLFSNGTEYFVYDDLDRLTKYPNAIGQQEVQDYDMKGRITKNNLGTYGYDTVTPKTYQNNSITYTPEAFGYYADREGIFNDSMEEQKDWQKPDSGVFFDKTNAHTGNTSFKIGNANTTEKYAHSDIWVPINNATETEYTYSAWVYSDNPQAELFLFMKNPTETGYFSFVNSVSTNVKNQWYHLEGTFKVPASVTKLNLRLDNNGQGNVWFDDVQIRKTSNVATFDKRQLEINYNSFKSPIKIEEKGVDIINFAYNEANQRSIMFYGSLDVDKNLRPYRKYYSTDGTMEIKENRVTNTMEFITYLGGDGYSAPIALKSDGINPAKYLYLHRDYQGSIMAISNDAGDIVEKRLFDAWGNVISVQDGAGTRLSGLTILDRGYTGHEHLQSVGLINMNARLYDPKLHRFLQPDNFVQSITDSQNYNRYSYVLNNPLKYVDPSGETGEYPPGTDTGNNCPECTANFIAAILNSLRDPANKDWLSKNLSARSIDKVLLQ